MMDYTGERVDATAGIRPCPRGLFAPLLTLLHGRRLARPCTTSMSVPPLQQLCFPDGIASDGNGLVRTGVTAPAFNYLRPVDAGNERLVDQNIASWNHTRSWLARLSVLRDAA